MTRVGSQRHSKKFDFKLILNRNLRNLACRIVVFWIDLVQSRIQRAAFASSLIVVFVFHYVY
jgi:hypothetical protein